MGTRVPVVTCGISTRFRVLSPTSGHITHLLLTSSPLYSGCCHPFLARLACLIHAASVRSEPGSNSPIIEILIPITWRIFCFMSKPAETGLNRFSDLLSTCLCIGFVSNIDDPAHSLFRFQRTVRVPRPKILPVKYYPVHRQNLFLSLSAIRCQYSFFSFFIQTRMASYPVLIARPPISLNQGFPIAGPNDHTHLRPVVNYSYRQFSLFISPVNSLIHVPFWRESAAVSRIIICVPTVSLNQFDGAAPMYASSGAAVVPVNFPAFIHDPEVNFNWPDPGQKQALCLIFFLFLR
jgi:hypothetical protein